MTPMIRTPLAAETTPGTYADLVSKADFDQIDSFILAQVQRINPPIESYRGWLFKTKDVSGKGWCVQEAAQKVYDEIWQWFSRRYGNLHMSIAGVSRTEQLADPNRHDCRTAALKEIDQSVFKLRRAAREQGHSHIQDFADDIGAVLTILQHLFDAQQALFDRNVYRAQRALRSAQVLRELYGFDTSNEPLPHPVLAKQAEAVTCF